MSEPKLKITLVSSLAKCKPNRKANANGLGLRGRIGQTVTLLDRPEIRGMINKISDLLKVEAV